MRRMLLSITLLCILLAAPAGAHTQYCGHTQKSWTFISPTSGATTYYREKMFDMWGVGPHYHLYKTQRLKWTSVGYIWETIHDHIRSCPGHPV